MIRYYYIKHAGSLYLGEIVYGPNTITFYYKKRSDKITGYIKGSRIEQNLILDKIETKYNSAIVKKYEFKYNYPSSNYTRYSLLNEVIEYGTGSSRLNSTVFSYQTPDNVAFEQRVHDISHPELTTKSVQFTGDFNGDGKTDFLCLPTPTAGWTGLRVIYGGYGDDAFGFGFSQSTSLVLSDARDIMIMDI